MKGMLGKVRALMLGALAALRGRASWTDGMGFLPTRSALGLPEEPARGDYCVEAPDEEILASNLDLRTARAIARRLRNEPRVLRRGARVRDQRTGEVLRSGVGPLL